MKIWKIATALFVAGLVFFVSGCSQYDNSERSMGQLVSHMMQRVGGSVSARMMTAPVRASDGLSMKIAGREVAFYKYDLTNKKSREKLKWIREGGVLYINGIRYEAEVNGVFVMIDHVQNVKKKEIIRAFKDF